MRIDPEPEGSEFTLLVEYLDYQRETVLAKTEGLTPAQMVEKNPPSALTLAGLLYHLSLVEESWLEVRFSGLPEREPVHRSWRRTGEFFRSQSWTTGSPPSLPSWPRPTAAGRAGAGRV